MNFYESVTPEMVGLTKDIVEKYGIEVWDQGGYKC